MERRKTSLFIFSAKISIYIMETDKVDKLYILKGECVMLKDTMKNYVNDMREAEKELINYAFEEDMFEHMDDRENLIMAKLIKLLHRSYKIVVDQAEAIDNINAKLDKLIEKK